MSSDPPSAPARPSLTVVDHPVVQHKLTRLRRTQTDTPAFRAGLREIGALLAYEASRFLPLSTERIETPMGTFDAPVAPVREVVIVAVLRAGLGMVDGLLTVLSEASVGHIGLQRNHETLQAEKYYFKLPPDLPNHDVILVDPMLATANSAIAATTMVKELKPRSLRFLALVSAPEGIAAFHAAHPDVPLITAAVDSHLNEQAYIVPGLGDAGDRIFGTR